MRRRRISFSFLLPLVELAIWAVVVIIPAGVAYSRLNQAAQNVELLQRFGFTLSQNQRLTLALESVTPRYSRAITDLNLPGGFVQVLISLLSSHGSAWHPEALTIESWLNLSLPVFSLPAWWLVGLGLDGLVGRRRLNRVTLVTGSILSLLFLIAIVGHLTAPPRDQAELRWLVPGFVGWALAFGVLPLVWLRQHRLPVHVR